MKKILTILLVCCFFFAAKGQGFEPSVKLYTQFSYFSAEPIPIPFDYEDKWFRFKGIIPTFQLYNDEKWVYHEIGISDLFYKKHELQLQEVKEYLFGLQYEYGRVLDVNLGDDWQLRLGGTARLFYYHQDFSPLIANRFDETYTEVKAVLGLSPHIQYHINDDFSLDLNTVVSFLSIGSERRYFDNPFLTGDSRVQKDFNTDFFFLGDFLIRFGISYHL